MTFRGTLEQHRYTVTVAAFMLNVIAAILWIVVFAVMGISVAGSMGGVGAGVGIIHLCLAGMTGHTLRTMQRRKVAAAAAVVPQLPKEIVQIMVELDEILRRGVPLPPVGANLQIKMEGAKMFLQLVIIPDPKTRDLP